MNGRDYAVAMVLIMVMTLFGWSFISDLNSNSKVDNFLDDVIPYVEKEGYVSGNVRYKIEEYIDQNTSYSQVDIDGTDSKVDKGKPVTLRVSVSSTNLKGGVVSSEKFFKKGIAK